MGGHGQCYRTKTIKERRALFRKDGKYSDNINDFFKSFKLDSVDFY